MLGSLWAPARRLLLPVMGTTRGTAALVKRAEQRLESQSRATPPKQIFQLITGRTKFVNLRTFGVVPGDMDGAAVGPVRLV